MDVDDACARSSGGAAPWRGRVRVGILLAGVLLANPLYADSMQDEPVTGLDWVGDMLATGVATLGTLNTDTLFETWNEMVPEDLDTFWATIEATLSSGSLDDLAALDEYAHQALRWMDTRPELEPMADWFRQRLDYLDVAASLELPRAPAPVPAPRPKPTTKPPARRPAVPKAVTAPAPRPASPTAPAKRSIGAKERKVDFWKDRLKHRTVSAPRAAVIPRLKEIFREEGVPEDLVWMAETESTLNPAARSPAGAVGLFQFMPATAGRFGLKTSPRDERLEPEKSARAAARYLRFLNGRFKDWPLALAAYNAGEGRVGSALKRSRGTTFEAAAPHLPTETQMYVPKVLATIALREGRDFDDG